jgi:hypothetical protein
VTRLFAEQESLIKPDEASLDQIIYRPLKRSEVTAAAGTTVTNAKKSRHVSNEAI